MRLGFPLLICGCCLLRPMVAAPPPENPALVERAFAFLAREQDRSQEDIVIFDDRDSGYEHFVPSGWMADMIPDEAHRNGELDTHHTEGVSDGLTCVKLRLPKRSNGDGWGGLFWEYPENNGKGPAVDILRYMPGNEDATLQFKARHLGGPSYLDLGVRMKDASGGFTVHRYRVDLTSRWQTYRLKLPHERLSGTMSGFSVASKNGLDVLLDDARVSFGPEGKKLRMREPRFIRSYTPEKAGAPDRHFRNACYAYDNALCALAFCARGEDDDVRRAQLICDAFLIVQEHDPVPDGRIRSAYMCGELLDTASGRPRIPGYWDDNAQKWIEDAYSVSLDTGNMAWVAIALLECRRHVPEPAALLYLQAARRLCEWIYVRTRDVHGLGGYTGGIERLPGDDETAALRIPWRSTEHNLDIYAAFSRLAEALHDDEWRHRAEHGRTFVLGLLKRRQGNGASHLPTGTTPDGRSINETVQPVDVNAWAVLALRDPATFAASVLAADKLCRVTPSEWAADGGFGYDFNEDKDGIWWEGTAQMALASLALGRKQTADEILESIRLHAGSKSVQGAIEASTKDGLSTGFQRITGEDWVYWRRPQAGGATCWTIFACLGWNPYWGEPVLK